MQPITIGIIGCGVISDVYLKGARRSDYINVKSVADMHAEAAAAKAAEHGVIAATSPEVLLADPDISLVINLTVPLAHAAGNRPIVAAGKHVYAEKPLCASFAEAQELLALAAKAGVRVGGAPDTFMGASHQAGRRAIDEGRIGQVIAGAATVLCAGMEHWHPNPDFFFIKGGGPVLDFGPYYVTDRVQLL